jgi:hypothetical protein
VFVLLIPPWADSDPNAHAVLREFLAIPADVALLPGSPDEWRSVADAVQSAWLEKFPLGTPREEILAALPRSLSQSPPMALSEWSWESTDSTLEITSDSPRSVIGFACRGAYWITVMFQDDVMTDVDVSYAVFCV